MKRRQISLTKPLVFTMLFIGLLVLLILRSIYQEKLNQDLIAAIKHKDAKTALALLQNGADANVCDNDSENMTLIQTIIDHFVLRKRAKGDPILLVVASEESLSSQVGDERNNTSLIIRALLAHHAKPNIKDYDNNTPFGFVASYNDLASVRELIKYGADVNVRNKFGVSALSSAISLGSPNYDALTMAKLKSDKFEIIKLLIQNHADLNIYDSNDGTPLQYAITTSETEDFVLVKFLLDNGAYPNLSKSADDKPLQLAVKFHHKNLIQLLKKYGAK